MTKSEHGRLASESWDGKVSHLAPPAGNYRSSLRRFAPSVGVPRAESGQRRAREREGERGPFSQPALHGELTAHPSREFPADREPQPGTFHRPVQPSIHLHERLEDLLLLIDGDS